MGRSFYLHISFLLRHTSPWLLIQFNLHIPEDLHYYPYIYLEPKRSPPFRPSDFHQLSYVLWHTGLPVSLPFIGNRSLTSEYTLYHFATLIDQGPLKYPDLTGSLQSPLLSCFVLSPLHADLLASSL